MAHDDMPLLVVDTNVVLSAAIARSYTLDLIFNPQLTLIAPEFIHSEIEGHLGEIAGKSGLDESGLRQLFDSIFRRITVLSEVEYEKFRDAAMAASPDKDDWPFFALALKENCGIWSNEKRLKKQDEVRVSSTREIASLLH